MKKDLFWENIICVLSTVLLFHIPAQAEYKSPAKEMRVLMGTFVEVIAPDKEALKIAFDELERIDRLLSKYNPESEISQLNKTGELKVSPETFVIIKKSIQFYNASHGVFDITVGPLMDIWGFTDQKYRVPDDDQIKDTLKLIGSNKIILNAKDNVVKLKLSGMKLDLGGIAKGYAVDCAIKKLKDNNIESALVNAGGNIYCLGDDQGKPWKVMIKAPGKQESFSGDMTLYNRAVSTSGNYQQYFLSDSRLYAHIINPKTGYPSDSGLSSVTITARDATTADALSTILFIVGEKQFQTILARFPDAKLEAREIGEAEKTYNVKW